MRKMAGVVIGDLLPDLAHILTSCNICQEFANIFDLCRKVLGAPGIRRIIAQEMIIFFECRATASRVNNNSIAIIWLEYVNVVSGQHPASLSLAAVNVQRSTTPLLWWCDYLTAIRGQHTDRCLIDIMKNLVHDTAADKADAIAAKTQCRCDLG